MLLSTLNPVAGYFPSNSGALGSRVNVPPPTILRVNTKISSSSHLLQESGTEQETPTVVSRRDVMSLAAVAIAISSAKPAEAAEVANSVNPISRFIDLLKGKAGLSKPKSEGNDKKTKTESKAELPKPKTEGNEKKPPADNKSGPPKPKTGGGDEEKAQVNGKVEQSTPNSKAGEEKPKAENGAAVVKN